MYDITLWCIEKQKTVQIWAYIHCIRQGANKINRKSSVNPQANCMLEIQYKYIMGIIIVSRSKISPPD